MATKTSSSTKTLYQSYIIEEYHLKKEPYYVSVGDEIQLFEAAYSQRIPVILKGPTGAVSYTHLTLPTTPLRVDLGGRRIIK